jgi:hypothetical protein
MLGDSNIDREDELFSGDVLYGASPTTQGGARNAKAKIEVSASCQNVGKAYTYSYQHLTTWSVEFAARRANFYAPWPKTKHGVVTGYSCTTPCLSKTSS